MDRLTEYIKPFLRKDKVAKLQLRPGDTVAVHSKIVEGDKERTQIFKGVVINIRGSGITKSFTVRKISSGVGVERIFHLHSSVVSDIKVLSTGKVRRAKLFYLRELSGKKARIKGSKVAKEIYTEEALAVEPEAPEVLEEKAKAQAAAKEANETKAQTQDSK